MKFSILYCVALAAAAPVLTGLGEEKRSLPPLYRERIDVVENTEKRSLPPLYRERIDVAEETEKRSLPPLYRERIDVKEE